MRRLALIEPIQSLLPVICSDECGPQHAGRADGSFSKHDMTEVLFTRGATARYHEIDAARLQHID